MPPAVRDEIPPGTLDLLILRTLDRENELHGFAIAESIELLSCEVLRVEEGSLYPALQRMLIKGWIAGDWRKTPENRRARYYRLTGDGHKHLRSEMKRYERVSNAIGRILQPA